MQNGKCGDMVGHKKMKKRDGVKIQEYNGIDTSLLWPIMVGRNFEKFKTYV